MSHSDYTDAVRRRVVVFDGGAGTTFQRAGLTADDYGEPDLDGCHEVLNVTRPDVVAAFHSAFLDVGCDVVETNTFGAFGVPLAEYGIADRAYELAAAGAEIAASVAGRYSTAEHPRWVAGSIGPGTRFPTLGQIRFDELVASYRPAVRGLLDGGVDVLVVETQFDLLGLKAAVDACRQAMQAAGRRVPIQVQVTVEANGRMLPGTEIGAALAAIEPLGIDVVGINCATGPAEMYEHVRHLTSTTSLPVSVIPNAGLPQVVEGEMVYDLTPGALAAHLAEFVTDMGVTVVGGCCGTTPEHLSAVIEACRKAGPALRAGQSVPGASSIYSFVPFAQDTSVLILGERTNANGSRAFRDAMLDGDWDGCVSIGVDQVREAAHLVDLCVDYVGRDGVADMDELARRFATQVAAPIVLDSTEPAVMEAGLKWLGGRAVLNSANLEDGDGPGSRVDQVFQLARRFGAGVVCLLIDEQGQARDVEWKMRVAHRLHRLAVDRYGLRPQDLLFDALTFPLTTGDDDLRGDGVATLQAIRRIKEELPGAFTVLGISNCSFGLKPAARHVLNAVFLHEAIDAGLDAAILHAGKLVPLGSVDPEQRAACLDLVHDRRAPNYDPLAKLLALFEDVESAVVVPEDRTGWTIEQILTRRIVDGDRDGLVADLDRALGQRTAMEIVNDVLLDGMAVVGERFASGEMQLPFVLQSAETMKAAVAYLEPHMERSAQGGKGKVVLATVRGDVHDIGKNLVDIILTNNGYAVHNLGIKVPISDILAKAEEVEADAIGMSGLLVKSTLIMRDNLEEMARRGLDRIPVILGGAALTRRYVERDLRDHYPGRLFYAKDAFEGLSVLTRLREVGPEGEPDYGRLPAGRPAAERRRSSGAPAAPERSPDVRTDNPVFRPPFLGARVVRGIPIDDVAGFLNETALFRNQWHYRPEAGESDQDFKDRIRPELRHRRAEAKREGLLVPQVAYGYFAVNGQGNDLVVWTDETRRAERTRFTFPRQSEPPHLCIADFFRPIGEPDYAAFHVVTMGSVISEKAGSLFGADRYNDYLHTHGLGVEMAEALAEYWHRRIRTEWGFAGEDGPTMAGLFRQQYRGGRYSWGYPACPDLEDNATVAYLVGADRIGVACSEDTSWQYHPEQTTSAIIAHHPQAKYFIAR
ncbi:MAG TPA: methionine synthase [Acidimicrobiia bacterium]